MWTEMDKLWGGQVSISSTFFGQIFYQSRNVTRKSCQNDVRMKNSSVKMLMKLTAGYSRFRDFVLFNVSKKQMKDKSIEIWSLEKYRRIVKYFFLSTKLYLV